MTTRRAASQSQPSPTKKAPPRIVTWSKDLINSVPPKNKRQLLNYMVGMKNYLSELGGDVTEPMKMILQVDGVQGLGDTQPFDWKEDCLVNYLQTKKMNGTFLRAAAVELHILYMEEKNKAAFH